MQTWGARGTDYEMALRIASSPSDAATHATTSIRTRCEHEIVPVNILAMPSGEGRGVEKKFPPHPPRRRWPVAGGAETFISVFTPPTTIPADNYRNERGANTK